MSINNEIKKAGKALIERECYDLVRKYSAYQFLKARFAQKRENMVKINKLV